MLVFLKDEYIMKKTSLSDKGFTILEVLVAISLLSVGILAVGSLMGTSIKTSSYSQALTQANNLAQERLERLHSIVYNNLQVTDTTAAPTDLQRNCSQTDATASRPVYTCTPTQGITIGNRNFTWLYTVIYIDVDGSGTANPGVDGLKRIDVTVSWTDQLWNIDKSVTVTSLRAEG
jgi:type IV pilus modification protein PilV